MQNPIIVSTRQEPGLLVEWVYHGQILIYTINSLEDITINRWAEIATEIVDDWRADNPYLCVCDLSNIDLTPEGWQQLEMVVYNTPEGLEGRYGLVLPRNVYTHIIRQFIKGELREDQINTFIEREVFYNRREALVWVAKGLHG
ncbi:MAG: hypothetical protein L0154_29955 [Chloroflexi bacterium]|nr:hypothetical protein [Chloroflexota bacterium]